MDIMNPCIASQASKVLRTRSNASSPIDVPYAPRFLYISTPSGYTSKSPNDDTWNILEVKSSFVPANHEDDVVEVSADRSIQEIDPCHTGRTAEDTRPPTIFDVSSFTEVFRLLFRSNINARGLLEASRNC